MNTVHLHTDASSHPSLYVRILCHRGHDPISPCNRSYSYTPPSTVYTKDRIWTEVTHCPVLSCRSPMVKHTHKGVTKQRCSKPTCRKISHTHISCYFYRHRTGLSCYLCRSFRLCIHACNKRCCNMPTQTEASHPSGRRHRSCTASPTGQPLLNVIMCADVMMCVEQSSA